MQVVKIIGFIITILAAPLYYILEPSRTGANLLQGWGSALAFFPIIISAMVLMGYSLGRRFEFSKEFFKLALGEYLIWGQLQQGFVFIIYALLSLVLDSSNALMAAALIFGLFHFPNPVLMFSTMSLGMLFMTHFDLYGNIIIPFIMHGICASFLMYCLPPVLSTSWTIWKPFAERQREVVKRMQ